MNPTTFDYALAGLIAAFAVYGAVCGARSQFKFLFGLYFGVALVPFAVSKAAPKVAELGKVPANSLLLKTLLVVVFFLLFFCIGVLAFEKSPLKPEHAEDKTLLDRFAGLFLGAGKTVFFLYIGLCGLILFEKPLVAAHNPVVGLVSGSESMNFVQAHDMFGLPVEMQVQNMLAAALSPAEARAQLQAEMKKALAEITAQREPSAANKALADAIRTGDAAALSKDPRFSKLMNMPGMDAVLNPAGGLNSALNGAKAPASTQ